MYTVKEVAEILGVSVHTVRYYDDQGLIPGTKRDSYNQRIFDDMELEWLFVSISLRDTGLPLKEIKDTLNYISRVILHYSKGSRLCPNSEKRHWKKLKT